MPLSGKIPNVINSTPQEIQKSKKLKELASAIGVNIQSPSKSKIKYDNIITLCDADTDGSHIVCLLLSFFKTFTPEKLENGEIFVALPPLYRVSFNNGTTDYIQDEKSRIEYLAKRVKSKVYNSKPDSDSPKPINIKSLLNLLEPYAEEISNTSRILNIDPLLIEHSLEQTSPDSSITDTLVSLVKEDNPKHFKFNEETKLTTGIYKGQFLLIDLNNKDLIEAKLQSAKKYFDLLTTKLKSNQLYLQSPNSSTVIVKSFSQIYNLIYTESTKGIHITYLKGLGELMPEELWKTTLNPETRRMYQIDINGDSSQDAFFTFMNSSKSAISQRLDIILQQIGKQV